MAQWKRCLLGTLLVATASCGIDEDTGGESSPVKTKAEDGERPDASAELLDAGSRGGDASTLIDARASDGAAGKGDAAQTGADGGVSCSSLKARIRDFKSSHPDFEKFSGNDITPGLVAPELVNNLPKYTGLCDESKRPYPDTAVAPCLFKQQTSTEANFNQWYAKDDLPNVSQSFTVDLALNSMGNGAFEYKSAAFFPIDGRGFGNEDKGADENGVQHNFWFTTEVRTSFTYRGGERFTFSGDDDLWIFVNGKLALDVGGMHAVEEKTIDFDAQAQPLGIVKGQTYNMDIFHAERHTRHSNFWIRTNIECFVEQIYL